MCSDWSVGRHISLQCHPWSAGPGPVKVLRVFLCWVVEGGREEGCGEASVLGAQASGSGSRFHRDVSCFLCRSTHPPCAVVPWAPRSEKEPAFGSEEPRVPTLLGIPLPEPVMCHSHTRGCRKDGEAQVSPDLPPAWPFPWAEWDPAVALTGQSGGH